MTDTNEFKQSAIIAISSANTIILIPSIPFSLSIKLFITILKKNGEVLFPYGHPLLILIEFLVSSSLIYAADNIHLQISSSFLLFFNIFSSYFSKIRWSIESKAFLISKKTSHTGYFNYLLYLRKLIKRKRCTSHPYSGINPS